MAQSVKLTGTRRPVDWSRVTVERQEEQKSSIDKPTVGMGSDRNSPVAGAMTFSEIAMPASANKTLGVEDPSTENLVSQASAPRAANNPELEKTFQAWLSFQNSIRNRALELEFLWDQIKKQNPELATNIENSAEATYSVLFNYVRNRGLSLDDPDFVRKHVWKTTIIYGWMVQHWEQARRIIRGETAERRQQDRQSLHNLAQATNLRRVQLDYFFLGKDDPNNSFGGIKDPQKLSQVQAKAGEICSRVTAFDSALLYTPPGNKVDQDLYQACTDAAMLLFYGEAQEIVGGRTAQRGELNQLFNSLPQQSPPERPNAASQQLINNRTNGIFRAITGFDRPRNKAEERLLETLRNAILIQWNVNGAARIADTPESQSESRSTVGQNPQSQDPVERFKQRLKQKALQQLDENRDLIVKAREKYQNPDAAALERLRQVVEADERLESTQNQLENRRPNLEFRLRVETYQERAGTPQGKGPNAAQLQAQLDQNQAKVNEIQKVRITLLALYPASALLRAEDVKESNSDAKLLATLNERFDSVLSEIERARQGIVSGDIQLLELEPLVAAVREETPEAEKAAVDKYLRDQRNVKNTFQFLGFLGQIGLTLLAFLTKGSIAVISARIGTATGIGQALYEFEQASDLNTIAKTGQAGGNQLLADPEAARFNYIMGWVNLVLTGIDGVLAVREGGTFFRGPGVTERIMQARGAQVLSRLQPEEIAKFDRAMQLQRAGQIKEAQDLLDELKSGLKAKFNEEGEQIFAQANAVFQRTGLPPQVVSELNQFKNALPNDLQNQVPIQIDPNLPGSSVRAYYDLQNGLVSNIYIQVGPKAGAPDIQLHVPTVRLMRRYSGLSGRVRVLLERIGSLISKNGEPPVGSLAWEAKLEIEKLPRIVNERVKQLGENSLDIRARTEGLIEIEELNEQLARYEQTLNEMDLNPGVGFVAARGRLVRGQPAYSPRLQQQAIAAGLPDPEGAGVPEAVSQYHYYIQNDNLKPPYELVRDPKAPEEVPRYEVVQENGVWVFKIKDGLPTDWKSTRTRLADGYEEPGTFAALETALSKKTDWTDIDKALVRRWSGVIEELYESPGVDPKLLDDLLENLSKDFPKTNYENFCRLLRARQANYLASLPDGEARMAALQQFGGIQVDSGSEGQLLTAFRREDFKIRHSENIETIEDASVVQIEGTGRNADDAIRIGTIRDPNAPPSGDYLVEDKFGPNAFKVKQAQRYSSFLQNNGKVRTAKGQEYSGIIYFFDNKEAAETARDQMKGLSANIYIGCYDNSGNLIWLQRRN